MNRAQSNLLSTIKYSSINIKENQRWGKIESGEIGEVDPLADSGGSPALIRYARRRQAAVTLSSRQREEAAERGGQRGYLLHLLSAAFLWASKRYLGRLFFVFVLFFVFFPALVCSAAIFVAGKKKASKKAMPAGNCISR